MPEATADQSASTGASSGSSIPSTRSRWKDFIASIPAIRNDPSNFSAPPFVLDTKSAVELPAYWAERPAVFVAPAFSEDPAERAVLVLKWFISALRNQQYTGRPADEGVKKPLNAVLGELFLARWKDDAATGKRLGITRLVSEQVSHHPPVTACRVWNEEHGVSAEGYTRQEITFSSTMNIVQMGHAAFHLAKHNETYLIPFPDVKIKGILSGSLYPELHGTYHIPSTSGYMSSIQFGGKGLLSDWDKKHGFKAKVYRDDDADQNPLYTLSGHWDGAFTIHDARKGIDIETFDVSTAKTTPPIVDPLSEQDPWESRVVWREVREALERGDMQGTADAKSRLEKGQREMRKRDADGRDWRSLFYEAHDKYDPVEEQLAGKIGRTLDPAETLGVWRFRMKEWQAGSLNKPYHGNWRPDNTQVSESGGNGHSPKPARAADDDTKLDWTEPTPGTLPATRINSDTTAPTLRGEPRRGSNLGSAAFTPLTGQAKTQSGRTALDASYHEGKGENGSSPPAAGAGAGVGAMTATEKLQVEAFLRERYSTSS